MKVHYAIYLTAGFALSALVSPAHAGKSISWEGVQYYAGGQIQAVQMEEGHSIILARWEGIHASKDTTSPVHLIRLECAGSIDARRDGTFEANGYCMHTDRDGDKWVGRWWNNNKMPVAKFEVFHGSGKYAGATGGGTAKCTPLKPGTIDTMVCEQTGTIELK
ncbi:MAG: hypothetical protein ABL878_19235 [Burkholderiales bacterium]